MRRLMAAVVLLAWSAGATAETLYVVDRLIVGLRSDLGDAATVVKSVETGTALEVIERDGQRVRVREPQGTEGWIDVRYLTTELPTRARVTELQAEIRRLQDTAARPVAADAAKVALLETQLAEATARLAPLQAEVERSRQAANDQRRADQPAAAGGRTVLWLIAVFAMLVIGFTAGILWARESMRRRLGGMRLRI